MSEQQEMLNVMLELDPVILLFVLYLRQQKLELDNIVQEQNIRKRKIQELNDTHYRLTHCACPSCGSLPNKRMRMKQSAEEYKGKPGCLYKSKL